MTAFDSQFEPETVEEIQAFYLALEGPSRQRQLASLLREWEPEDLGMLYGACYRLMQELHALDPRLPPPQEIDEEDEVAS